MAFGLKLCFVVVVLVLLHEGESLKCYQCTSSRNGSCDDPLNLSKVTIQTCSGGHNSCILLNVTQYGNTEVRRECGDSNYCETARNKRQVTTYARACRTCSWSLCNSAASFVPSFAIGIAGLILVKYYL